MEHGDIYELLPFNSEQVQPNLSDAIIESGNRYIKGETLKPSVSILADLFHCS